MENLVDFLIYALVILLSIVGMISKSRKQTRQKSNPPSPWHEMEEAREDYEAVEWEREAPEPVIMPTGKQPRPEPVPPISQPGYNSASARTMGYKGESNVSAELRAIIASEGGRVTRAKPKNREQAAAPSTDEYPDLLAGFDIRKAVIYSEILKPKYEEF